MGNIVHGMSQAAAARERKRLLRMLMRLPYACEAAIESWFVAGQDYTIPTSRGELLSVRSFFVQNVNRYTPLIQS
jgi:hypothetical protein